MKAKLAILLRQPAFPRPNVVIAVPTSTHHTNTPSCLPINNITCVFLWKEALVVKVATGSVVSLFRLVTVSISFPKHTHKL